MKIYGLDISAFVSRFDIRNSVFGFYYRLCYNTTMNNLSALLRTYDLNTYYFFCQRGLDSNVVFELYFFFAKYGIVLFLFSFTYLIWKKKINAFICSFMAMGLAGLCDLIIFIIWRRPRPFVTHTGISLPSLSRLDVDRISSFPSSHTYIVFAIATSVYLYGHKRLGAALFVLAILVALGRIGTGLHYPSDTIAGALLGILSGIVAYRFVQKHERNWEYSESPIESVNI